VLLLLTQATCLDIELFLLFLLFMLYFTFLNLIAFCTGPPVSASIGLGFLLSLRILYFLLTYINICELVGQHLTITFKFKFNFKNKTLVNLNDSINDVFRPLLVYIVHQIALAMTSNSKMWTWTR